MSWKNCKSQKIRDSSVRLGGLVTLEAKCINFHEHDFIDSSLRRTPIDMPKLIEESPMRLPPYTKDCSQVRKRNMKQTNQIIQRGNRNQVQKSHPKKRKYRNQHVDL